MEILEGLGGLLINGIIVGESFFKFDIFLQVEITDFT